MYNIGANIVRHLITLIIVNKSLLSLLLVLYLATGCGGGGGTKSDDDDRGDATLGVLMLAGIVWGVKEMAENSISQGPKIPEKSDLKLASTTSSVYDKLNFIGGEPRNFGVYTYILFGKYPTQGKSSNLYKKYKAILDIVQENPYWPEFKKPVISNDKIRNEDSYIKTENLNIYLIPLGEEHKKRIVSVSDYNFDYSMRILHRMINRRVSPKYRDKFLSDGPFLVSMPSTIQDSDNLYMLFADLSNVSEELVRDVFQSYENALRSGSDFENTPFGIYENIRISLVQKLVDFNDVFKVIGNAYAAD